MTMNLTCSPTLCLACLSLACLEQGTTSLGLVLPMQFTVQTKPNAVLVLNSHSHVILTQNYVCVYVCCDNHLLKAADRLEAIFTVSIKEICGYSWITTVCSNRCHSRSVT